MLTFTTYFENILTIKKAYHTGMPVIVNPRALRGRAPRLVTEAPLFKNRDHRRPENG